MRKRKIMKTKKKKFKREDVCCERFLEAYKAGEISHSYKKHTAIDETEWYINGLWHLYYCPFCGGSIKGRGTGDYDEKQKPTTTPPRQYSLVKFNFDRLEDKYHSQMPFTREGVYVFFGDIPNMLGHCVVADHKTGQIFSGYHTDNFVELSEEEA
jgi:hypothetical protein